MNNLTYSKQKSLITDLIPLISLFFRRHGSWLWFSKSGWDDQVTLHRPFQTDTRVDTHIHIFSECAAAFELFSKDNAEQLLGIAELDLVLRSLGQVHEHNWHLIYARTSNSKATWGSEQEPAVFLFRTNIPEWI